MPIQSTRLSPPPAPQPEPVGIGRQRLPRPGAEGPPHCDRHGGACPERRCSCGRRNSGGSRRQSAALSGRPPAVRLTARAQKRGHHRSDGPFFWFHVCVYTEVGSSGRFSPAPRCHRLACPSASIQSLGAAPASEPLLRGEPYPYIKSERLFFHCIASAWRKAPIIRRAGAAWAVLADTAHACAKSQREVVSGSTKQKNCTSTGTANKPYDTCLNHKQLHPPWTGEASCASYTGRYSDSGIQRGSRLPRA